MIIVSNGHETLEKYLINWNENKADAEKRNYDFSKDFFDFFRAINTCMLGDFNAWVHYAAKRYYALLGDGTTGAGSSGSITKRGYIMAHFAKFVLGITTITSEGTMPAKVFDLQGRQLSTQSLKPGIYIKNGKKFIVR